MARRKIPAATPDPDLKAKIVEEREAQAVYVNVGNVKLKGIDRVRAIPDRPAGYEGLCGAPLKGARKGMGFCKMKPHFPGTSLGGGRCKHHGGLTTGAITEEGKKKAMEAGITHAQFAKYETWDAYRRSKYSAQEQAVHDQVPTTPDLEMEIRAQRLKIEHIERNRIDASNALKRMSDEPGFELSYYKLDRNKITGELSYMSVSLQRWMEMENAARDTLRKMLQAQKDINPSGKAKGNMRLDITISGAASAQSSVEAVPELTEDVDSRPLTEALSDEQPEDAPARKDDDVEE